MELRPLIVKDIFIMGKMLAKVSGHVKEEMSSIISLSKAKKNDNSAETLESASLSVGFGIMSKALSACLEFAETDLVSWMASLIGKTANEFNEMPPGTIIDIIEELKKKEEISAFFSRAFALFNETKKLEK